MNLENPPNAVKNPQNNLDINETDQEVITSENVTLSSKGENKTRPRDFKIKTIRKVRLRKNRAKSNIALFEVRCLIFWRSSNGKINMIMI